LPLYALPQRFVEQIHGLLASQLHYLFPYFSALGGESGAIIRQVEDRVRWVLALVAVVLYGAVALFGQLLLTVLVGSEFAAQAQLPLQLACLQGLFMAQVIFNYYVTWSQNEAKVNALYDLTTYAGSCLLAVALIPALGVTGAALAKLVVVPLFFYHLYHSRLLLKLPCNFRPLFSPYVLPFALFGYLAVSQWLLATLVGDWRWRAVAASFLLPLGCVAAWRIEIRFFEEQRRGEILSRLVTSLWSWLKCLRMRHPA
jgi:O-antigen/teichoic acid export membrane protein